VAHPILGGVHHEYRLEAKAARYRFDRTEDHERALDNAQEREP
jgi:hypothetical protein